MGTSTAKPAFNVALDEVPLFDDDATKTVKIGYAGDPQQRNQVAILLREYRDIFAWSLLDMTGVSPNLITHRLNLDEGIRPVRQKQRHFAADRNQAIREEVHQLLRAQILFEVKYPTWIANPVMIKKQAGGWRMCVDYTDLNKHCPKDCYPLPNIDKKVEALVGHETFCFLDLYKGYHQVFMSDEDAPKTAFVTDFGIFAYKKMPFGLKNAGATYQRMVDKIFQSHIGKSVEVYVDDIVVKSKKRSTSYDDLRKILAIFRQFNLKLNPEKCTFMVEAGKFLGCWVSKEGLTANPKKVRTIQGMQVPKSVNDVHKLAGCLASLSRFLSKAAERQLPFFKVLRKAPDFKWEEEHEVAFNELKAYLADLPTLSVPKEGETLSLYLAASDEAVSAVLVREEGGRQLPVYFVSRSLKGPETRYQPLEKGALALVNAARRLRPYFQAHHVRVLTDLPLRQILTKPEASGRVAKWAIELGEHGISFCPRLAIKGQALADFLVEAKFAKTQPDPASSDKSNSEDRTEKQTGPPTGCWKMYVDGASNKKGKSGAGILLISPDGNEIMYRLRFGFPATNNEAEYEALISGLRIATDLKVPALQVFSDSQVVVNHVLGEYEAKDDRMRKYLNKAKILSLPFGYFQLQRIPRGENSRADALSKAISAPSVPEEEIKIRSIDEPEVGSVANETDWRSPILKYLEGGELPEEKTEARKVLQRSLRYDLDQGILYRKSYLQPLLRCIGPSEADYILREIHEGSCGSHIGARALAKKAMLQGYYWPTLAQDALNLLQRCPKCQIHGTMNKQPQTDLVSMQSSWPFAQWGVDIVGPLDTAPGRFKFLIVAIDYFTKWVEAEPLTTITSKNALNFVWRNIVCRFGVPNTLVSDNGTQFTDKHFREWCEGLRVQQKFTSVAHPQANGQTEVTNRTILRGLKKRLDAAKGDWVGNLPNVLWSYRTTPRTSNGETPYSLVYGTEAVIPVEIGMPSPRTTYFSPEANEENLRTDLDLVEEKRDSAYIREARYKQQVAKYYNRRVRHREFTVGDLVLRNNEASRAEKLGKLEANWEGPYQVTEVLGKGSYKLATLSGQPIPRTWNINHLKKYYMGG